MRTRLKELRRLPDEKLLEKLKYLKIGLINYYIKCRGKLEKHTPSAKDIKKEVARIKTILRERK